METLAITCIMVGGPIWLNRILDDDHQNLQYIINCDHHKFKESQL